MQLLMFTDIVSEDGVIDRKALGAIVFTDKTKMDQLTSIVWPEIWKLVHQQINDAWNQGMLLCIILYSWKFSL